MNITSANMEKLVEEEFPQLFEHEVTYLDHTGASLYSKSQIDAVHRELNATLLCNPHTNFGNLKVKNRFPICYKKLQKHEYSNQIDHDTSQ